MKGFLMSFVYAANGLRASFADQRNLKVQSVIAVIAIAAGLYYDISATEWCLILLCMGLVMGLELMNSAVERLVDLITMERRPAAGKVKDMAAGAVLFASIIAVIVGGIIFGRYVM